MLQKDSTLLQGLSKDEIKVVEIQRNAKKFRDYDNSDFRKLCFFLLKKCSDYGREKPPIAIEVINWTCELGRNYPNLSLEDLKLAFDLAVMGRLNYNVGWEWKTVTLEKFIWETFLTINKVITGYVEYQRDKLSVYNQNFQRKLNALNQKTKEESIWKDYVQNFKEYLYLNFQIYKRENKFEFEDKYCSYFRQLNNAGLIDLSKEDYINLSWIVDESFKYNPPTPPRELKAGKISDFLKLKEQQHKEIRQSKICTLAIKCQFDIWIDNNVDVKELIRNLKLVK